MEYEIIVVGGGHAGCEASLAAARKNHKTLFKKDSSLVTLDTAKKRMQQVIPSKHKEGTMNQSEELNVFRQHALLIVFLIYKTSYQQFLSSPTNRTVPDSKTFEEVKKNNRRISVRASN